MSSVKRKVEKIEEEEPECLILTLQHTTGQKELLLIPIGQLDGRILYIEGTPDQLESQGSGPVHGVHSKGY